MIPRKVLIFWANRDYDFMELLRGAGVKNPREGDLIFCPFHDDRNHKSAKIFKNALHCFSETKQYRPYDILKHLGFNDARIESNLRAMGNPPMDLYQASEVIDIYKPLQSQMQEYIKGKIDFYTYIDIVTDYLNSKVEWS